MRTSIVLMFAAATLAPAVTVNYIDPFGSAASTCASRNCDVIGNKLWYDLDRVSMTADSGGGPVSLFAALNFGPNSNALTPFRDAGVQLDASDVLFAVNGVVRWGLALTSHAGSPNGGPSGQNLAAGHFYSVNSPSGMLTAFDVLQLGAEAAIYRPDQYVWLRDDGRGSVTDIGAGRVTVAANGDGLTQGKVGVSASFQAPGDFIQFWAAGQVQVIFSSATCGNDIGNWNAGQPEATPEPATLALTTAGMWLAFCARQRKVAAGNAGRRLEHAVGSAGDAAAAPVLHQDDHTHVLPLPRGRKRHRQVG